jgi:hypothetical protein
MESGTIILDSVKAMLQSSLRAVRKIKEITFTENLFAPISKILFVIFLVIIFNIQNYLLLGCECGFEFAFDKTFRYQRSCYSKSSFFRDKKVFKKT